LDNPSSCVFTQFGFPIFQTESDLIRNVPLGEGRIQLASAAALVQKAVRCIITSADGQIQSLEFPETETVVGVLKMFQSGFMSHSKGSFGLGLTESRLLPPDVRLATLSQPVNLFVVSTFVFRVDATQLGSRDPISLSLSVFATVSDLKETLRDRFPDCAISQDRALIAQPDLLVTSLTQPLSLIRADAVRSLPICFADSTTREFLVDGNSPTSAFIPVLAEQVSGNFTLNSAAGNIQYTTLLKDLPGDLRIVSTTRPGLFGVQSISIHFKTSELSFSLEVPVTHSVRDLTILVADHLSAHVDAVKLYHGEDRLNDRQSVSDIPDTKVTPILVHIATNKLAKSASSRDVYGRPVIDAPMSLRSRADFSSTRVPTPMSLDPIRPPSMLQAKERATLPPKPPDYDQLLRRLHNDSGTPLKICKTVFEENLFNYDRTLKILCDPDYYDEDD
jgi:hypothetical protein